jgi:primosomal protein N'
VVVSGSGADQPTALLAELRAELERAGGEADLLGPAPLLRLRGRDRVQLLAKTANPRPLAALAGRLLSVAAPAMRKDGLAASVDVDPQGLS